MNVRLIDLVRVSDARGHLVAGEWPSQLPFAPRRFFHVFGVPSTDLRGEHAHRQCEQFLVAVAGSLSVIVDDGAHRDEYLLDSPSVGLYMPPMTWGVQHHCSPDAVLLVLASHAYDPDDYIRNYDEFRLAVAARSDSNG